MDTKFTPAPWALEKDPSQDHGQFVVTGPDGVNLAAVEWWMLEHHPESRANAHLIATAPELFERLAEVLAFIDPCEIDSEFDAARAALRKARGEA